MTDDKGMWTLGSYVAHNEAMRQADLRLQAMRDTYEDKLQEVRDEQLAIQAKEYERRLETLNHENARVAEAWNKAVPREILDARLSPIEEFIAQEKGRNSGQQDSRATIAWVIAIIASLIAIGSFVFRISGPIDQAPSQPQIIYVPAAPGTLIPSPSTSQPPQQGR